MIKKIFGNVFALVAITLTMLSGRALAAPIDITAPAALLATTAAVALNGPVVIQFSEYMADASNSVYSISAPATPDEGTVKIFIDDGSGNGDLIAGTITFYPSTNQAIFIPLNPFVPGTKYTVQIDTSTKTVPPQVTPHDQSDNLMTVPFAVGAFTTTTTADVMAPSATLKYTTNVAQLGPVLIQFSETMQNTTQVTMTTGVGGTVQVRNPAGNIVDGTIVYDASSNVATFTPTAPFSVGVTYTVYITTGLTDLSGNALPPYTAPALGTFTAIGNSDVTPPNATLATIADVALNGPVVISFDEAMLGTTITTSPAGAIIVRDTIGNFVAGSITYSPATNKAAFIPTTPFAGSATYNVQITTGPTDIAGNHLVPFTLDTFTTSAGADITQPNANLTTIADVPLSGPVVIQFVESMQGASITYTPNGAVMIIDSNGNFVAGSIVFDVTTNKASITPFAPFTSESNYSVYITSGPVDLAGNPLVMFVPDTFTTVKSDTVKPIATLLTTIDVPLNGPVEVGFSEAIVGLSSCPTTADTTPDGTVYVLNKDGNFVPGGICFDVATNKASFTPTAPFSSTLNDYTVYIAKGLKDFVGNSLNAFVPATFTVTSAMRTVTASVVGSGAVSPASVQSIATGGTITYTLVPGNINFVLYGISLNNVAVLPGSMPTANPDGTYTFTTPAISTNTNIVFTFSNGTYTLTAIAVPPVGGSITPAIAKAALGGSQSYSVAAAAGYTLVSVVATNKISGAAATLVSPYTLSGITSDYDIFATFIADSVKPTARLVSATSNVGFSDDVVIHFNEAMQPGSISTGVNGNVLVKDSSGNVVAGSIVFNQASNQAIFTPAAPFAAISTYTVIITAGLFDLAGNSIDTALTAPYNWPRTFITTDKMFNVSASAVGGGSVTPVSKSVANGGTVTYTLIPSANYVLNTISVNGTLVTAPVLIVNPDQSISWSSDPILAGTNIIFTFVSADLTLEVSAGQWGTISPSGSIGVAYDGTKVFAINPAAGYTLDKVLLDGVATTTGLAANPGNTWTYTLSNIRAAHTIKVTFTNDNVKPVATFASATSNVGFSDPVVIQFNEAMQSATISTGFGGTISVKDPLGNVVAGSITFDPATNKANFTPTAPFIASTTYSVIITTEPKDLAGNSLTAFTPVSFTTTTNMWNVTASSVGGGTVTPALKAVANGGTVTYAITLGVNSFLSTISVNGTPVTVPDLVYIGDGTINWTSPLITASTNIIFTFVSAAVDLTLSVSAGQGGTISPNGNVGIAYDSDRTFTITPSAGYILAKILLDGVETTAGLVNNGSNLSSFTLYNITESHTIAVSFTNDAIHPIATFTSATTNVGFNAPVVIQFNEEMQPATITTGVGGTVLVNDSLGNLVAGTITYDASTNKASFVPTAPFKANSVYRVTITTDPKDLSGNSLAVFTPVSFTTVFATARTVNVIAGAGGIVTNVPAFTSGVTIPPGITGVIKVSNNGQVVFTITPDSGFMLNQVLLDGTPQSLPAIDPITLQHSYTLSVGDADHTVAFSFSPSTVILSLSVTDANGFATLYAKFGDARRQLNSLTFVGLTTVNSDYNKVYWNLACSGGSPALTLFKDAAKNVVVASGNRTGNGMLLLTPQNGSGLSGSVNVACTDNSSSDTDGGNYVHVFVATEEKSWDKIVETGGTSEIVFTASPGYLLGALTDTIGVLTGTLSVLDSVSDSRYIVKDTKDHTVVAGFSLDKVRPYIKAGSRFPADLATGVSTSPEIKVTFNEPMNAATLTPASFIVKNPDGPVLGSVSYDAATRTAKFTPTYLPFENDTTYNVWISNTIKDANGNSLDTTGGGKGAVSNWSFTTRSATHAVTLTVGANGTVMSNPVALAAVPDDTDVTFTITPYANGTHPWYQLDQIIVDGSIDSNYTQNADGTYTYTLANVVKDRSVNVTFKKVIRTVTVSAYSNGTVTGVPALTSGSVALDDNSAVVLTFTPSPGYTMASLTDNGISLSLTVPYSAGLVKNANNSWTYSTMVIANRTLSPSFANNLTVQSTAWSGGEVTPASTTVSYGGSQTFTVTPADGYKVNQFKVNGVVKSLNAGNQYTETNVTSNLTAAVTFTPYLYKIKVNQAENGTISPSGAVYLDSGTSTFVITPNTGYKLTAVNDSNGEVFITGNNGEAYTYTTLPVSSSFTFSATIALKSYAVTMTAGANGAVSANGVTTNASSTRDFSVSQGGAITFTVIPDPTYALSDIKIDGVSVKNAVINNTYTLTADRVTKSYSVAVSFEKLFVVTASAGPNGTINPLGTTNLTDTANTMEYTFTPSAGYSIEKVIYAGNDVTSGVVENHYLLTASNPTQSIQVTFILSPVNSKCGAANGTTVTTIPTSKLCEVGSPSAVSSSLPWSWTCAGINSGTSASCSASIQTYAVSFVSGSNGTLTGTASQTVNHGSATAEVTAVSAAGYQFLNWSGTGGFITTTANPLTVYYVTSIQELTANFIKIPLKSGVVIPAPNKTEPGIEDALRILNIAAGKISRTQEDLDQGDVAPLVDGKPHGNNMIDTYDAIGVLRMVVGLL